MKTAWDDNGQNYLISKISLMMFKAVGMAPFNIKKLTTVKNPKLKKDVSTLYEFVISRTGFAYNLCIIIGHWYLGICSILKHQDVKYTGQNELTDKIEICLSGYGNLAITVMWLVHCVKQRQFTTLINRLMYVDANLTRLTDKRMTNLQEKSEVLQLAVMYIMNVCIWIPLLVSEKLLFEAPIVSFFGFMVPAIYCNWFALQYVVAVKLIQIRFKRANDALLDCSTKRLVFPLRYYLAGRIDLDILKVAKIAKIRNACMSLYDIASGIADFYSFPILSVLGYICVHLTYMTYYFVAPFILDDTEKHTNWLIFNSILWLTILTFPFVVLARSVNAIKAEMKRTADIIPIVVERSTTTHEDRVELHKFAFDLLHKDVKFTAHGFCPLDEKLVQSVFGLVISYITILLQFRSGRINTTNYENNENLTEKST